MFDFLDVADEAVFGEGRQMMTAKALREQMGTYPGPDPRQLPPGGMPQPQGPGGMPMPQPQGPGGVPMPSQQPPQPQPGAPPMPPAPAPGGPGGAPAPAGGLPMASGRAPADLYAQAGEIRKRAYGLEPDPKVMEEERSKAQANVGYGSAISALGTERMRPTGGAVLQQALRRQGELEMDPEKQLARQVHAAEAEAQALERQAATAISAEDRKLAREAAAQARADANELKRQMHADTQTTRQMIAGGTASRAAERRADREEQEGAKRTDTVRREYNTRFDKLREANRFADDVVKALADPNIAKNAPAQVALVMQFGKMLDPDSVVREAEQQMIERARGVFGSLEQLPEKIRSGARLTKEQLAFMNDVALQYQSGAKDRVGALNTFYKGVAERNKLPVADIIQGSLPVTGLGGDTGPAKPPPTGEGWGIVR